MASALGDLAWASALAMLPGDELSEPRRAAETNRVAAKMRFCMARDSLVATGCSSTWLFLDEWTSHPIRKLQAKASVARGPMPEGPNEPTQGPMAVRCRQASLSLYF